MEDKYEDCWVNINVDHTSHGLKDKGENVTVGHVPLSQSEKREMEDKLSRANQEILTMRDQFQQLVSEKEEYRRQRAIAQQENETLRKELDQANEMLEKHRTALSEKPNTSEADDIDYWRNQAAMLKHQNQELTKYVSDLEEFRSRIADSQKKCKPCQDKQDQIEQFRKQLEQKSTELQKMTKKVSILEMDLEAKKKKKDSGATAPPQESVEAQKLARTEQLYNDASEENQELHKQLANWKGRFQQFQNQNLELQRQIEIMRANLKEQDLDKQLQKITATFDDSSLVNHPQLQMRDMPTEESTNDITATRNVLNLPVRAHSVFDDISTYPQPPGPLRAVDPDNLPSPIPPGPTYEQIPNQDTPLPRVPASTVPAATNYHQGQPLTVADQMQRFRPGMSHYVDFDQLYQPQPGYAGGPGKQMVSDSPYPPQQGSGENEFETLYQKQMLEREQQKQYQLHHHQVKEEEHQLQQKEKYEAERLLAEKEHYRELKGRYKELRDRYDVLQQHNDQLKAILRQQNISSPPLPKVREPTSFQYQLPNQEQPSLAHATPQGQRYVTVQHHLQESPLIPPQFPNQPQVLSNHPHPQNHSGQSLETVAAVMTEGQESSVKNTTEEMTELAMRSGLESMEDDAPIDPNLICQMCRQGFRIGEIQKYRCHVTSCTGSSV